jgi:hypothetical protein
MLKVFKYELTLADTQTLELPVGAQLLRVADQRGTMVLWALVNPDARYRRPRTLRIAGTGHFIEDKPMQYICTFPFLDGLVFHAFEVLP